MIPGYRGVWLRILKQLQTGVVMREAHQKLKTLAYGKEDAAQPGQRLGDTTMQLNQGVWPTSGPSGKCISIIPIV